MGCAPIGGVRRALIASRVSDRGLLRRGEHFGAQSFSIHGKSLVAFSAKPKPTALNNLFMAERTSSARH